MTPINHYEGDRPNVIYEAPEGVDLLIQCHYHSINEIVFYGYYGSSPFDSPNIVAIFRIKYKTLKS